MEIKDLPRFHYLFSVSYKAQITWLVLSVIDNEKKIWGLLVVFLQKTKYSQTCIQWSIWIENKIIENQWKIAENICTPFKRTIFDLIRQRPATFKKKISEGNSWNQLNNCKKYHPCVNNGHWRKPKNVPLMSNCLLYTGSNYMHYSLNGEKSNCPLIL